MITAGEGPNKVQVAFRLEWCDNGSGRYSLPWIVHDDGRRRRASEEEAVLWQALQAARLGHTEQAPVPPVTQAPLPSVAEARTGTPRRK